MMSCLPANLEEIAHFVSGALKYDTSNGALSLSDFDGGKALRFKIVDEAGKILGGYTLNTVTLDRARVVWIETAAGGDPGVDIFESMLPAIRLQARALEGTHLNIVTCRPGMVKKMKEHGFAELGTVLGEKL